MEVGGVHGEPLHGGRPGVLEVEGEPGEARQQQERSRTAWAAECEERDPEADQRPACRQVGKPVAQLLPGVRLLLRDQAQRNPGASERDEGEPTH